MASFPAEFSTRASREIKKLDVQVKGRILERINRLEQNPFPQEVERVENFEGEKIFRVRVGDYRLLYVVRYNPSKLIVVKVDKRSRVYN